ncbi:MAG: right-handed parallel beta-helix repeat-containing protein [Ruminococcus sp.]|nr:right-handed parallel beta-helix repeat-containing protein [Ruminococcus sp.]
MKKSVICHFIVFLILLFGLGIASVSVSSAVTYTNKKGSITVKYGTKKKKFTAKKYKKNFSAALNAALDFARKKGKATKIAKVTISKGNYSLDRTIKIYSNTTLSAKNCRLRLYGNLLRNGYKKKAKSATGYSGAKNITIKGGTWDAMVPYSQAGTSNWRIQHSTFRFAHCTNVKIQDCNFVGNYNCHDIEFGAVKNSKIYKCSFSNKKAVNTFKNDGGREAIQLDVATYEAMPEFVAYDKTPTKSIEISKCSFKNKFRGVGSHHAVPGRLFDKISVHDNTFNNIGGIAVYGVYWTDSQIYNNKMTNVGLGVDMRSMTSGTGYNFRNMDKLTNEQCEAKIKNKKIHIFNNTISVRVNNNTYVRPTGIRVLGENYSAIDLKTGIKPGTYNYYNVNIGVDSYGNARPNIISGNVSVGIQVNYVVNSVVKNNIIDSAKCAYNSCNGIEVKGCLNTVIDKNTISNGLLSDSRGVYLTYPGSSNTRNKNITVTNNKVTNYVKNGISFHFTDDSKAELNTITKTSKEGVYLKEATNNTVTSNNLTNCGENVVFCTENSNENKITSNTIADSQNGVLLKGSVKNTVDMNTITNCTQSGIYSYNNNEENIFEKNNITKCGTGAIVQRAARTVVRENNITDTTEYGIRAYSTSTECTFNANIIKTSKTGISVQNCEDMIVSGNSISDCSQYGVNVYAGSGNSVEDNEINACAVNPVRINHGADKVSVIRNTINSDGKDCIYVNGENDDDKTVEKFVSIHDNVINSPDNNPSITGSFGNVAVQAYSNILNGVREDEEAVRPNYMRFKGDVDGFKKVENELKITNLSLEEFEDSIRLSWQSDYDDVSYRVAAVLEDGTISQIAVTNEKSYEIDLTKLEDRYEHVTYWVAPVIFFENVKYLGMNMTAEYAPVRPTTETETESVTDTQSTTVESSSTAPNTTDTVETTEPQETESQTVTEPVTESAVATETVSNTETTE